MKIKVNKAQKSPTLKELYQELVEVQEKILQNLSQEIHYRGFVEVHNMFDYLSQESIYICYSIEDLQRDRMKLVERKGKLCLKISQLEGKNFF